MNARELPESRVLSRCFLSMGRSDVVKIDVLEVNDEEVLKVTFEHTNSDWRQGVWLKTDGELVVEDQHSSSIQLWRDSASSEFLITCRTQNGLVHVYNIWDRGNGRESQAWTSGMLVEDIPNGRRYRCNDIGIESSFDKLVFRIERISVAEGSATA